MPEPVESSTEPFLHEVSGALGDPDDALLSVTRRPAIWASVYGMRLVVLGCFVAGGYPRGRTLALAGVALDVFAAEPPTDWKLLKLDNVIGSPLLNNHQGGAAVFFGSRTVGNLTQTGALTG